MANEVKSFVLVTINEPVGWAKTKQPLAGLVAFIKIEMLLRQDKLDVNYSKSLIELWSVEQSRNYTTGKFLASKTSLLKIITEIQL